ncbi:MAG: EsaB/YukD family protein [Propioniciclava sp.]
MAPGRPVASTLLPLAIVYRDQRIDLALPGSVPVAELLPGIVTALGRLTADSASHGFRMSTAALGDLDQAQTLAEQSVVPGAVLTLTSAEETHLDVRYDDLVEAIGVSVASNREPWQREDSIRLAALCASGLFLVAALLLLVAGNHTPVTVAVGLGGALLATLVAAVLVRIQPEGALPVALCAPGLAAAGAASVVDGPLTQLPALAGGAGLVFGSVAVTVLPLRLRASAAAPLVIALGLLALGLITWLGSVPDQRAAALVLAGTTVLVLAAPWIGLAQVPARIEALAFPATPVVDPGDVAQQVRYADVTVLAVRIGGGILTLALTPLVATTALGAALIGTIALAHLLGTRSLHGRAEVYAGVATGLLVGMLGGISLSAAQPELLPWVAAGALCIGGLVLILNVLQPQQRSWASRAADIVHVIALAAVLPLTALLWGAI